MGAHKATTRSRNALNPRTPTTSIAQSPRTLTAAVPQNTAATSPPLTDSRRLSEHSSFGTEPSSAVCPPNPKRVLDSSLRSNKKGLRRRVVLPASSCPDKLIKRTTHQARKKKNPRSFERGVFIRRTEGSIHHSSTKASSRRLLTAGISTMTSSSRAAANRPAEIGRVTNTLQSPRDSSSARRRFSSIIGPRM
mgnify:CR=1 FL=1